jgi:hypothetical protein
MMRLYQPVMFVGLGGTGCDVGAELERRLREEICGADGTEFLQKRDGAKMLPYQLPSCVQFVYADMNQAELDRMPSRVVPGITYQAAARATAHYVRDLVPMVDSYPELARNLRLRESSVVESWLPPRDDEPRVNPLHRGAGQFPTVGRAALFGTFTHGIRPAIRGLNEALGQLSNSGEDLHTLGGKPPKAVDVFVAFSVAGGTGGGIFYDYLHMIGHVFEQSQLKAKIYPLVLMPSAFDPGLGGGRIAELNSGRAMLDLFRLVDEQNGGDAESELRSHDDKAKLNPDEQAVHYPVEGRIVLRPGIVQTGFLFSRPIGAQREDLHRSIASLVTSLIGTELEQQDELRGESHQSFADSFVNSAVHRDTAAENGIGNRGVSAALVASLTVPVDEIADIIAGRLLRAAIDQLSEPPPGESNKDVIADFVRKAGTGPVLAFRGTDFVEPEPARGARAIAGALGDRRDNMISALDTLASRLDRSLPQMVATFDPRAASMDLLGSMDIFRARRVIFGHARLTGVDEGGVQGVLESRAVSPENADAPAPPIPQLNDRFFGLRPLHWGDAGPARFRERQDGWYRLRTRLSWSERWSTQAPAWRRPLTVVRQELDALIRELNEFAREDKDRFGRRTAELYRRRTGVSYLLPPGGGDMDRFYERVIRGLIDTMTQEGKVTGNSTEADLVRAMAGGAGWRDAFEAALNGTPKQAVTTLRDLVKRDIKSFLREGPPGQPPMLPRMHDLLAAAAGPTPDNSTLRDYLDEFRGKLAGLLPANFTPQGQGPLRILISYPADARNRGIEEYLKESINLPAGPGITEEPRPTRSEAISVVLLRTEMGVTEVREVGEVLRLWAGALARPEPADKLAWRQRTGYDFGYLATREENRVQILHRLLCAMWNGRVTVTGPVASPQRVRVQMEGDVAMNIQLAPLGPASSWASILRAYELWTFDDSEIHRLFCSRLMRERPDGLESHPREPDGLYVDFCELARDQIKLLDSMVGTLPRGGQTRLAQMRGFWADTLPAARGLRFPGAGSPLSDNLSDLDDTYGGQ